MQRFRNRTTFASATLSFLAVQICIAVILEGQRTGQGTYQSRAGLWRKATMLGEEGHGQGEKGSKSHVY